MRASLQLDGRLFDLDFSKALAHVEGEFSGNIDLTVTISPSVPTKSVLDSLRLEMAGEGTLLDVVGYLESAQGLKLTFCSEYLRETKNVPRAIEAFWGASKEVRLGAIPCAAAQEEIELEQLARSEHSFANPEVRFKANLRGVLALTGLLLFLLATIYGLFPEVRQWFN